MKKIYILFLLILPNLVFAIDYSCFENMGNITNPEQKTIKIISDTQGLYFYQDDKLLNSKLFKDYQRKSIDYKLVNKSDLKIQGNTISFDQYKIDKEIIIKFSNTLTKNTFNYDISSNTYDYKFEISPDGKTYFKIKDDLKNYNLDYLKIIFTNGEKIKNINIFALDFFTLGNYEILVNSKSNSEIKSYSNYICNDNKLYKELEILPFTQFFPTDIDTKSYNLKITKNRIFNQNHITEYKTKDSDNDGISDINDNCLKDYNPTQIDSNSNGAGDICDDNDEDGISGKTDNCPSIYNPTQKDINSNNIGDDCEFDKDKDGIFDSVDNCINESNSDQKDTDNDSIGDVCDNCKLYNPEQKDENQNKIGDVCEEQEKYEKINDSDKDGILDFQDNCKEISNKDQKDFDKDSVGDSCDNCFDIQNLDQKDENKNNKGDMCEDIDKDGIEGYKDNCSTIPNPDQKDINNDGVGESCEDNDDDGIVNFIDNCLNIYNPDQKDVDNDKIGDSCDKKDDRFIESNKYFFIGFIVSIAFLFLFGIYVMIRKVSQLNK